MTDLRDHIQHQWTLTRPDGDEITIDLWIDDETVRVHGGDHDEADSGRTAVEQLLAKYQSRGYQVTGSNEINDRYDPASDEPATAEPDGRPDACPECGSPVEYEPNHTADFREGEAWLCTGCKWGEWITA